MPVSQQVADVVGVAREHAERVDTEGTFPGEAVAELRGSGLLGLVLPVEAGGQGAGPAEFVDVMVELAAACGSTAMIYLMHTAAAVTVAAAPAVGSPGLLAELASGRALGTLAFSERGSRSHFWAPVSVAISEGDAVTVKADKSWVTSAGHADVYIVSTGSPSGTAGEIDLYALNQDIAGLTVARHGSSRERLVPDERRFRGAGQFPPRRPRLGVRYLDDHGVALVQPRKCRGLHRTGAGGNPSRDRPRWAGPAAASGPGVVGAADHSRPAGPHGDRRGGSTVLLAARGGERRGPGRRYDAARSGSEGIGQRRGIADH